MLTVKHIFKGTGKIYSKNKKFLKYCSVVSRDCQKATTIGNVKLEVKVKYLFNYSDKEFNCRSATACSRTRGVCTWTMIFGERMRWNLDLRGTDWYC